MLPQIGYTILTYSNVKTYKANYLCRDKLNDIREDLGDGFDDEYGVDDGIGDEDSPPNKRVSNHSRRVSHYIYTNSTIATYIWLFQATRWCPTIIRRRRIRIPGCSGWGCWRWHRYPVRMC